jgi:hypothetical protein
MLSVECKGRGTRLLDVLMNIIHRSSVTVVYQQFCSDVLPCTRYALSSDADKQKHAATLCLTLPTAVLCNGTLQLCATASRSTVQ